MHLFSKFIHEKISITKSKNFQGDLFLATMEIWAGFVCAGEYVNPYKKQYTFEAALVHFLRPRYLNSGVQRLLTNEKEQ